MTYDSAGAQPIALASNPLICLMFLTVGTVLAQLATHLVRIALHHLFFPLYINDLRGYPAASGLKSGVGGSGTLVSTQKGDSGRKMEEFGG